MKISAALVITLGLGVIQASPCQDSSLGKCFCSRNKIEKYFNIYCPDPAETRVTITLRVNSSLSIVCHRGFRSGLSRDLPGYFSGTELGEIPVVKLKGCSAPGPGQTFSSQLGRLGLAQAGVRALVVSSSRDKLGQIEADSLAGLPSLQHLGLANNGLQLVEKSFFSSTPDIKILDLSANRGVNIQAGGFLGLSQLEELRLISCNIASLPASVFSPLLSLTSLNLQDNDISFLPQNIFAPLSNLSRLTLSKNSLKVLPERIFQSLGSLSEIDLSFNQIEKLPSNLFEKNRKLTVIILVRTALTELPQDLLSSCKDLRKLIISRSKLAKLPQKLLSNSTQLEHIDFSFNNIENIPESFFSGLENLQELILTSNKIRTIGKYLFYQTNKLRKLIFRQNILEEIDEKCFQKTNQIEEIDLSGNNLISRDIDCFKANKLPKLERLDLSHNKIDNINMEFFFISKLHRLDLSHNSIGPTLRPDDINFELTFGLTLDLSYNRIQHFDLSDGFETAENADHFLLNISGNPITCDCTSTELKLKLAGADTGSLYEKMFSLTPDLIVCANNSQGQSLQNIPFADLNCPIEDSQDCPADCTCQRNTYYREMTVDCSHLQLRQFPENIKLSKGLESISLHLEGNQLVSLADSNFEKYHENVSQLYLSNNRIEMLNNFFIPPGLRLLNLDQNKIAEIGQTELLLLESLVSQNNLTLAVSRNNLSCSCSNKQLYHFLKNRQTNVEGEIIKIFSSFLLTTFLLQTFPMFI